MPEASFLEISSVTKRFGEVTALHDVDVAIPEGSFFSLLGASGCGKTTLLRIIAGFEQPDAGDLRLEGRSLLSTRPERRPFNIVFQRYALFPHMTVAANVAFGLTTGGRARGRRAEIGARVADMLELVGLAGFDRRYPAQLSGGQAQRVALARALINRPRLLLLDEPLSALDRNVRLSMREYLLHIHRELGTTFLLVTHDQEEALGMSTHVALMNEGRIEQVASPEMLYRNPGSLHTARFLGAGTFLRATPTRLVGERVEVTIGDLQLMPLNRDAVSGSLAFVFLRPEEIEVVLPEQGLVSGEVDTCIFSGSHYEITCRTDLAVFRIRTNAAAVPGDRLGLRWRNDAGICFAAPPGEGAPG